MLEQILLKCWPMISSRGDRLAFLLSMPRSGSTLLSLMLGSHPEICCPPEPWIVLAVSEYLELGNVRSTPYGRDWAEIAAIEFLLNPEKRRRGTLGGTLRAIGETADMDALSFAKTILRATYQMHLNATGKSVFIDKTPRYYTVLGLIGEIFPCAKKIVLLRNPLDIFASYKSTWNITRRIFTPEGVSVHTRDFCEGLFVLADYTAEAKDDVLVLRYEDLTSDPESTLRIACKFVGIDFSPAMLAYYENAALIEDYKQSPVGDPFSSSQPKPANSRTVNAWAKRLDAVDIQSLIDLLGVHIFERLGYSDTVASLQNMSLNTPTEEQAFERRNLLMRSLVDDVHERPFSTWNSFVSPLEEVQSDRAARLEVIQQQSAELEVLSEHLNASESDRAARLELIHQQQAELEELRGHLDVSESDRAARLELIHQQLAELESLRQRLAVSESDRAARLELIHQQLAELESLRQRLAVSESDRAARLELIHKQLAELEGLRHHLEVSESDRAARLEVNQQQQSELARLRQRLEASESERTALLEVIPRQQQDINRLQSVRGFLAFRITKAKKSIREVLRIQT